MMRVLIYNQKGGVGKTTTAANLGAALARAGAGRIVLADLDPQMHLTASLGQAGRSGWTVRDWREGRAGEPDPVEGEAGLFLVRGHADPLAEEAIPAHAALAADWLIYDAPPGWNGELAALMAAADLILSPLEADFLGLNGVSRLMRQMQEAGVPWERLALLVCRYSDRLAVHREVRARLAERFGTQGLLPHVIRNSVRLAEAPGQGRTVFRHAPTSTGAADYAALARHLMLTTRNPKRPGIGGAA
jgi:chromosome partitioning protein